MSCIFFCLFSDFSAKLQCGYILFKVRYIYWLMFKFVLFALKLLFCSGIYGVPKAKSAKNNTIQKIIIKFHLLQDRRGHDDPRRSGFDSSAERSCRGTYGAGVFYH